jgi:hypothetical protein
VPDVSETLVAVQRLVPAGNVRISEHGYDEMAEDGIFVKDVIEGIAEAAVVEDYPEFPKGPAVLVLQFDGAGQPVHVVWGIPRGHSSPAVLVTAYRPDPKQWSEDFRERLR